jgi:hypothetical protein
MQRSISSYQSVASLLYVALFILYSSLSSMYPVLPPFFAVLLVLFSKAIDKKNSLLVLLTSFCLVVFEVNFGYILFSSIIYFYIVIKFIMPKIEQSFSCTSCINIAYVLLAYIGYFLFLILISNIFLLDVPSISYYIVYYIVIEFFIVSLL